MSVSCGCCHQWCKKDFHQEQSNCRARHSCSLSHYFLREYFPRAPLMLPADSVRGHGGQTIGRTISAYSMASIVGPSDCATTSLNLASSKAGTSMQAAAIISAWSIVISATAKHRTTRPSLSTKRAVQVSSSYAREDTARLFFRNLPNSSPLRIPPTDPPNPPASPSPPPPD